MTDADDHNGRIARRSGPRCMRGDAATPQDVVFTEADLDEQLPTQPGATPDVVAATDAGDAAASHCCRRLD